jgi:MMPL family
MAPSPGTNQERRKHPLAEAITVAMPAVSRAVTVAGVTLACSFATLALIPLSSFREFAFAMFVGVLVDTFVVRSFLIPALISAVGDRSWWPSAPGPGNCAKRGGDLPWSHALARVPCESSNGRGGAMSEANMVNAIRSALRTRGIEDEVVAAGQFNPRGHSGGLFVGALAGDEVGGAVGGAVGEAAGFGAGSLAGMHAAGAMRDLPDKMLVGVSASTVYGFAGVSRRKEPKELAFQVPREGLTVRVHPRVNVRILELIHEASGSRIELEGSRVPVTHTKDVIKELSG